MSKTLARSLVVLSLAAVASQVLGGCFVESRPRAGYYQTGYAAQPVYYNRPATVYVAPQPVYAAPAYGATGSVYVR